MTNLKLYVCMVSDTLLINPKLDKTKIFIEKILSNKNIQYNYTIIPNNKYDILKCVISNINKYDTIILLGGTGISNHDITIDTIKPLLEKELDGFGEYLRNLSYKKIGPRALMSRATAGKIGKTMVFILPGNPSAIKDVLNDIIIPIASHGIEIFHGKSGWKRTMISVVEKIDYEVFTGFMAKIWREKKSAVGVFIGKVKYQVNEKKVEYMLNDISYESLSEITEIVTQKYGVDMISVATSGKLYPGDPIFMVAVFADDRNTMKEALGEIIELFKNKAKHIDYYSL